MPKQDAKPVSAAEAKSLFAKLEHLPALVLAVSGGPDSTALLWLAALHKKEAACATLAEVGRKYPRASASVKRSVAQEQKRVHC